jgi:hypothetical protein
MGTPTRECESASDAWTLSITGPEGHAGQAMPLFSNQSRRLGAWRRIAGSRSDARRQLAGATGTSRAREWAARPVGPAGEGRRRRRARGEAGLPRTVAHRRRAPRATRTVGFEHAVVMAMAVVPEDHGAGKEYDRQDEDDPGDNHHPRRGRIEPRRLGPWRRRGRRSCGDGSRLGRMFGCFAHTLNIAQAYNRRNTFRQQTCCESRPDSSVPE